MNEEPVRERILNAAEDRARTGGFHGFSFRDVAADVGVKSSSVHYHFPTKTRLGVALVERYVSRTAEALGRPEFVTPDDAVTRVTAVFREALIVNGRMCLCGLFASEADSLPAEINTQVRAFYTLLIGYLEKALGPTWSGPSPASIVARLEGSLLVARVMGDDSIFEKALELPSPGLQSRVG